MRAKFELVCGDITYQVVGDVTFFTGGFQLTTSIHPNIAVIHAKKGTGVVMIYPKTNKMFLSDMPYQSEGMTFWPTKEEYSVTRIN